MCKSVRLANAKKEKKNPCEFVPWLIRTATHQGGVACLSLQSAPTLWVGAGLGTSIWRARQETEAVGFGGETSAGGSRAGHCPLQGWPIGEMLVDHHGSAGCSPVSPKLRQGACLRDAGAPRSRLGTTAVAVLAPGGAVWLAPDAQERLELQQNVATRAEVRQGPAVVRRDKTSDGII